MNAIFKKQMGKPLPAFAPGDVEPRQSGKRKVFEKVESLPLKWPQGTGAIVKKARFDLFDAWHGIAMQILHRERASFRMMAVTKIVIRWSQGIITNSNAELAERAGNCDERTIKRDVADYLNLGLFLSELDWKRPGGGKFITVRTLRLALPVNLPEGIILPESIELSRDSSGPDMDELSRDSSGPGGRDHCGPSTIDHKKGGSDAA